ncbi:helix-turn-helix domain containing protein [Pseudomonas denitrificans (nom. rej.)]|nr:helix-turn-helix domain containing protein [Pseudomonas denitrificans (nom. rej.)]
MTAMQQQWYVALVQGAEVNLSVYQQVPAYRTVVDQYRADNPMGSTSNARAAYLAMKRAEQAFYRAAAAANAGQYRANQSVVDAAVLLVIDTEGDTLPREALTNAGVPDKDLSRISSKPGARRKVKKALGKHSQHPNAQRVIQNEGKREYMRMAADTLSGSLEGIAVSMKTQARLARLEAEQVTHAQRIAELEARLAMIDTRHAVEDAGLDPKAEALRLYSAGLGYKAIAARIGRSPSSVRNWVKAA